MTLYLHFTLIYAFRSTIHCLWNLFGSDANLRFSVFPILTPRSFYLYFEREMYYLSFIFYTEWRKDPWTLEATH